MSEVEGAVIGINVGNSYGSIACINQHGRADVIANENGERQIATRIAFNGDQVYNGNEATPQLVRNAANVIDQFVNLVGRSYAELSEDDLKRNSAPVIDVNGAPSFEVDVDGKKTVLSAHDVLVRYFTVLYDAAKDFMSGVPIVGTVLSAPLWFNDAQIHALEAAAREAGLTVLHVLSTPAAALVAYGLTAPTDAGQLPTHPDGEQGAPYAAEKTLDRNVVVVDFGGSSFDVSVVAARAGVYSVLAYDHDRTISGRALDDVLVAYFAKEFTKKTKVTIGDADARAWAKLRNEAEVTKRSLSASNTAQCSVESLADGIDFSGSVNRMRFNLLAGSLYTRAQQNVAKALEQAKLDASQVDEVVLAGGAARLSGLVEQIGLLFAEDSGTHITSSIDSDQVIARGNAVHAQAIVHLPKDAEERAFIEKLDAGKAQDSLTAPATTRPIGVVLDAPTEGADAQRVQKQVVDGQLFVTLIPAQTPVPARRAFRFPISKGASSSLVRLAEGTPSVRVDQLEQEPLDEDDEDDEPLEPEEVKTAYVQPDAKRLVELDVPHATSAHTITVEVTVLSGGQVDVEAKVDDASDVAARARIGA